MNLDSHPARRGCVHIVGRLNAIDVMAGLSQSRGWESTEGY